MSSEAVYRLRDVTRNYQAGGTGFRLSIPHLDILPGTKLAFVGESGSGKSTLLELLAMVLRPSGCAEFLFRPDISADPHDIDAAWNNGSADRLGDLRSRYIGYVLQSGGLLPYLSVRDNIDLSRRLLGMPEVDTAGRLAEKLRIADQLDKLPAMLSVGQRQRVAIARALAHEPRVLIADEPTAAIDPINAELIGQLLVGLADELGVTLIMATHAHTLVDNLGFSRVTHAIQLTEDNVMEVTVSNDES